MNIDEISKYSRYEVKSNKIAIKIDKNCNFRGSDIDQQIKEANEQIKADGGDTVISRKGSILTIKSKFPVIFNRAYRWDRSDLIEGVRYYVSIAKKNGSRRLHLNLGIIEFVSGFEGSTKKFRDCLRSSVSGLMSIDGVDEYDSEKLTEYYKKFIDEHSVEFVDRQSLRFDFNATEGIKRSINNKKSEIELMKSRGATDEDVAYLNDEMEIVSIKEIKAEIEKLEKSIADLNDKTLSVEFDIRIGDNYLYFINTRADEGFYTELHKASIQLSFYSSLACRYSPPTEITFACQDAFKHLKREDHLYISTFINGNRIENKNLNIQLGLIKRKKRVKS
ncbi:hypothetical protein [Vibrio sp. V15_P4S5T153]|uniref:hypothetical protein n=1 Tax=Vibrio sp. V15_P4S5T153 TaxID=1938669 RepID=UPI000B8FF30B|nr:hypothetical protein [Vibrio sp. V15_P4S5T153]OXX64602.1 hypothetical protein B9J89_01595 [Vibrio sp. V15_P4S5T153]